MVFKASVLFVIALGGVQTFAEVGKVSIWSACAAGLTSRAGLQRLELPVEIPKQEILEEIVIAARLRAYAPYIITGLNSPDVIDRTREGMEHAFINMLRTETKEANRLVHRLPTAEATTRRRELNGMRQFLRELIDVRLGMIADEIEAADGEFKQRLHLRKAALLNAIRAYGQGTGSRAYNPELNLP